jgi:hypothetical protein
MRSAGERRTRPASSLRASQHRPACTPCHGPAATSAALVGCSVAASRTIVPIPSHLRVHAISSCTSTSMQAGHTSGRQRRGCWRRHAAGAATRIPGAPSRPAGRACSRSWPSPRCTSWATRTCIAASACTWWVPPGPGSRALRSRAMRCAVHPGQGWWAACTGASWVEPALAPLLCSATLSGAATHKSRAAAAAPLGSGLLASRGSQRPAPPGAPPPGPPPPAAP